MKSKILKYALQNAIKFEGKANPGAVIGKLFSDEPSLKEKAKEVGKEVAAVVAEVNRMSLVEQISRLRETAPELLEEKKEKKKKELPPLKNAEIGKVVTRIPPEPSKYLHIGHALSFIINYMYAKKYNGKCILRFEDTNPLKARKEFYEMIEDDINWLKIKYDKKVIVSDDMKKFYAYAEKLINLGEAYVCFCPKEKMDEYRGKGEICDCRSKTIEVNKEEWNCMLSKNYKDGQCTLRLKGQMDDENMVMRDPVIFRICTAEHPLQGKKYVVWPMYDFENAVEEHLCGITHIMRSAEFGTMRIELQDYIKELLKLNKQEVLQYSRFNVTGAITQGREIRKLIEEKKVIGWDDPRLVTLKALKRRGIQPETFYELAVEAGLSLGDTNLDWSLIAAINRKIIDPITPRYFFVENPKKVKIKNAPLLSVNIDLHPGNPSFGKKGLSTTDTLYIEDALKKGITYRLIHLFNFKDKTFISEAYDQNLKAQLIHWLPAGPKQVVDVEIMMEDGKVISGLGERNLCELNIGDIVQFQRKFFARLDKKDKTKLHFWFTHR